MQKTTGEHYDVPNIEVLRLPAEALCQDSIHYSSSLEDLTEETDYEW